MNISMTNYIGYLISNIFPSISYIQKAMHYLNTSQEYSLSFGYFERTAVCIITILLYTNITKKMGNYIFCNSLIIYYLTFYLLCDISVFAERLPLLFIFSYWITLPNIIFVINRKYVHIAYILLILLCSIKIMKGHNYMIHKYQNFTLFKVDDYKKRANDYLSNDEIH